MVGRSLPPPCFVLGPHRSGATIVARSLAASGRFVYLSAADIVAAQEEGEVAALALRRLEAARDTRRIDDVEISADVPEEYGFLLPERQLTDASASRIAALHRRLAEERGRDKAWLLRNPRDLSRTALIERHFPGAHYVFVARDPVRTIDSQVRALRTLFSAPSEYHALVDDRYRRLARRRLRFALVRFLSSRPRLVDGLVRGFARTTVPWLRALDALPRERWVVTRHEDLVADPVTELTRLYAFLDLPPEPVPRVAAGVRARERPLDPHVESRADRIRERTAEYREAFGY